LIKIISEFYYILIESLTCVRIFLLVFRLEIEVAVENILEVYHIEISVNDNVLTVICFLFTFLYIGENPVKIYFGIINFGVLNNIVAAVIIKLIIILSSINSKIF
jgi:hypothetical protein